MVASPIIDDIVAQHHTKEYPTDLLTVRRGLSVPLATSSDSLSITPISASPRARGRPISSAVRLQVDDKPTSGWAVIADQPGQVSLIVPVTASIGLYAVDDGSGPLEMAVVFNPFAPEDTVYMADSSARDEYIFNETGVIWRGSSDSFFPGPWDFAQFDKIVVLTALWLIQIIDEDKRADPVEVSRHLSAAVNANDENGVLVGRWDGKYDDGTPPTQWSGSGSVVKTFYNNSAPVKYGQCWVFAGVLTSVCRALGIPCRVTSNFSSAHDTTRPYNRAVDMYFDKEGNLIEERSADSVWNFHVWCCAWMKRPDLNGVSAQLGISMDGWQAIDSTPQELSEGMFQMGPSPLNAVKNGYTVDYDTDFVIGEVNADVLYYWQDEGSDKFEVQRKRTSNIGKFMSTKAIGSNRRNDVTNEYKYPEGSAEERAALANRVKPSDNVEPVPNQPTDMQYKLKFEPRVKFGDDIKVAVQAKNTGSSTVSVRFASLIRAIRYTGEPTSRIDNKTGTLSVGAGKTVNFSVVLTDEEYQSHLIRDVQTIKFNHSAKVAETGQTWADECIVRVYGDDALSVSAPRTLDLGQTREATVTVTNSFRVALTNVVVKAEGRGLAEPSTINLGTIEPGASKRRAIELKPTATGDRTLVVTLDTEELQDIIKSARVSVRDRSNMSWLDWLSSGFGRF